jgi:hypothetical protein
MHEFDVKAGKIAAVARTKIIQDSDSSFSMETLRQMAADKSSTAGD